MRRAIVDSFTKLNPRTQARNPVMFVVLIGSVWTTVLFFQHLSTAATSENVFVGLVAIWLWFTVLFANFAEAVAEGPGQGAGRHPAPHPPGDGRVRAPARRLDRREGVDRSGDR